MSVQKANVRNRTLEGAQLYTAFNDLDEPDTFLFKVLFSEEIQSRFDSGEV